MRGFFEKRRILLTYALLACQILALAPAKLRAQEIPRVGPTQVPVETQHRTPPNFFETALNPTPLSRDTINQRVDFEQKVFVVDYTLRHLSPIERARAIVKAQVFHYLKGDTRYDADGRLYQANAAADSFEAQVREKDGQLSAINDALVMKALKLRSGEYGDVIDKIREVINLAEASGHRSVHLRTGKEAREDVNDKFDTSTPIARVLVGIHDPEYSRQIVRNASGDPDLDVFLRKEVTELSNHLSLVHNTGNDFFSVVPAAEQVYENMFQLALLKKQQGAGAAKEKPTLGEEEIAFIKRLVEKKIAEEQEKLRQKAAAAALSPSEQRAKSREEQKKIREDIEAQFEPYLALTSFLGGVVSNPEAQRSFAVAHGMFNFVNIGSQILAGGLNPFVGLNQLSNVVGEIVNLFSGVPSVNEQILTQLSRLMEQINNLYEAMMSQFKDLKEEIAWRHRDTNRQLEHLKKELGLQLKFQSILVNQVGQGATATRNDVYISADVSRLQKLDERHSALAERTDVVMRSNPSEKELEDVFTEFATCANLNSAESTFTGASTAFANLAIDNPDFLSMFVRNAAWHWKAPYVSATIQDACCKAGNPLCSGNTRLPNWETFVKGSYYQLLTALQSPDAYSKYHLRHIPTLVRRNGRLDREQGSPEPHLKIRESIATGHRIQEASHRMVWKDTADGPRLNREFLDTIVTRGERQYDQVRNDLNSRREDLLSQIIEFDSALKSPALEASTFQDAVPSKIGVCGPTTKTLQIELTAAQRQRIMDLVPRDVRYLTFRDRKAELEFCITDEEIWEEQHWGNEECTKLTNDIESCAQWYWGRPGFKLEARLNMDSQKMPLWTKKMLVDKAVKYKKRVFSRYLPDGSIMKSSDGVPDINEQKDRSFGLPWQDHVKYAWEHWNHLPPKLFDEPAELNESTVRYVKNHFDTIRNESLKQYYRQMDADYANQSSPPVYESLLGIEGEKRLIGLIMEVGYEKLLQSDPALRASIANLDGAHTLGLDIVQNKAAIAAGDMSVVDNRQKSLRPLTDQIEAAIENMERSSIEKFIHEHSDIQDSEVLAKAYIKDYAIHSQIPQLGRIDVVDSVVEDLETFYANQNGEILAQTNLHDSKLRITPQSVWGSPSRLASSLLPCEVHSREEQEAIHLSADELASLESKIFASARKQDVISYRVGLIQMNVCYRSAHGNYVEWLVSFSAKGDSRSLRTIPGKYFRAADCRMARFNCDLLIADNTPEFQKLSRDQWYSPATEVASTGLSRLVELIPRANDVTSTRGADSIQFSVSSNGSVLRPQDNELQMSVNFLSRWLNVPTTVSFDLDRQAARDLTIAQQKNMADSGEVITRLMAYTLELNGLDVSLRGRPPEAGLPSIGLKVTIGKGLFSKEGATQARKYVFHDPSLNQSHEIPGPQTFFLYGPNGFCTELENTGLQACVLPDGLPQLKWQKEPADGVRNGREPGTYRLNDRDLYFQLTHSQRPNLSGAEATKLNELIEASRSLSSHSARRELVKHFGDQRAASLWQHYGAEIYDIKSNPNLVEYRGPGSATLIGLYASSGRIYQPPGEENSPVLYVYRQRQQELGQDSR